MCEAQRRLLRLGSERHGWRTMMRYIKYSTPRDRSLMTAVCLPFHDRLYSCKKALVQWTESRIWPYTLDFGAHEGCSFYDDSGLFNSCPTAGEFPGVWEFPINPLLSKTGEVFSFDPTGKLSERIFEVCARICTGDFALVERSLEALL